MRRARQPERRRGLRAVERHRVLRQRRAWFPQQRRARRDDHRRPRRQTGRSGHAARARHGRRVRRANRRVPHLQTSLAAWTLALDSELVFVGDAGTTEAGRPSRRSGIELANYYSPRPWLILDGDLSVSSARFTEDRILSASTFPAPSRPSSRPARQSTARRFFGSMRCAISVRARSIEDNSVRSKATSLVNRSRLPAHAIAACRARRVQSVQRQEQRHRLLLHARGCPASRWTASTTSTLIRRCRALRASPSSSASDTT